MGESNTNPAGTGDAWDGDAGDGDAGEGVSSTNPAGRLLPLIYIGAQAPPRNTIFCPVCGLVAV